MSSGWFIVLSILFLVLAGTAIYLLIKSGNGTSQKPASVATDSTVEVSGTASVEAQPDEVQMVGTVQTVAATAEQSASSNDATVRQLLQRITEQQWPGATPPQIETQRYTVTPQYPLTNGQRDTSAAPISFRTDHALQFTFSNAKVGVLGQQVATLSTLLTRNGVNNLSGPFFRVTERNAAREHARQAAVRVAQRRAAELARLSGVAVVGLKEMRDSVTGTPFLAERAMLTASNSPSAPIQAPQSETITHTVDATYFVA